MVFLQQQETPIEFLHKILKRQTAIKEICRDAVSNHFSETFEICQTLAFDLVQANSLPYEDQNAELIR
jgi:hypothetical protein